MQADRLNRIIGVLALLYVAYIAIALLWSRFRDTLRNGRHRDAGLLSASRLLNRRRSDRG